MCGRATLVTPVEEIAEVFGVRPIPIGPARFNLSPGQELVVVRPAQDQVDHARELAQLRWGLVPWWSKDGAIARNCVQARFETVARAPAFRKAFEDRRCLVVVDGFYEWSGAGKARQPHHVSLAQGGPFAIAGVWDSWKAPDGSRIETCAVVTTAAQGSLAALHDRMPLVLDRADADRWLLGAPQDVLALTRPSIDRLVIKPVSRHVNDVRNDDAHCLDAPGQAPPSAQTTLPFV